MKCSPNQSYFVVIIKQVNFPARPCCFPKWQQATASRQLPQPFFSATAHWSKQKKKGPVTSYGVASADSWPSVDLEAGGFFMANDHRIGWRDNFTGKPEKNMGKSMEHRWFFLQIFSEKKTDPLRLMGFLWREQLYILNLDYWWVNNEYMMANDRIFCIYSEFILRLFWLNWILTGIFHGLWPPKYS